MNASNQLDSGVDSGMNVYGSELTGHGLDRELSDFPTQSFGICTTTMEGNASSSCTTTSVFSGPLLFDGLYSLRSRPPPNTLVDFTEMDRQRNSREQRSVAMQWTYVCKEIENLLNEIQSKCHAGRRPEEVRESTDLFSEKWKTLEVLHAKYLVGIHESKRLGEVQERYSRLKQEMHDAISECEEFLRRMEPLPGNSGIGLGPPDKVGERNDDLSISSEVSNVSGSSRKKSLKRALVSRMKLNLARAKAEEEAEPARMAYKHKQRMELRRLEEEATLAELEWKIETEYNGEEGVTPSGAGHLDPTTFLVDKRLHSTPVISEERETGRSNANPSAIYGASKEAVPQLDQFPEVSIPPKPEIKKSLDSMTTQPRPSTAFSGTESSRHKSHDKVETPRSFRVPLVEPSEIHIHDDRTPRDPVAAMWKAQLLSGIRPTQFSGNPVDFPHFREQIHAHLEDDLLTDAQRVEYLPKFVTGEALEVVKRNRGCSFGDITQTLEARFCQTIRVTQACVEDLVSGPKLTHGDSIGLMNFSEKLSAATRILQGNVEREASVATNLRRIVSRLPNDLIARWQNENYDIVRSGRSPRLMDVAYFVKKQASIRNDPVFGGQILKRDNKDGKPPPRPSIRTPTISAVDVEPKSRTPISESCGICKSKRHKFQQCPVIKKCDQVSVRRQYAVAYGFCFNCGLERPGHGSGSCPEPPACSRCPSRHLSLLHLDNNRNGRCPNPEQRRVPDSKPSKPSVPTQPAEEDGRNTVRQASSDSVNKPETPIYSAGVSTTKTQVLLNVVPVMITAENGNSVTTYAFLDSGCTDTLIDQDLVNHLGIQGTPQQIGINTITSSGNIVESECVSFTLSSLDSYGESIAVSEAYVLPDLNQSQRALPEQIDVNSFPHLCDLEFPAVDVKRVSSLVGNDTPYAHIQKEVRVPEDRKKGLYGCRYPLGWCVCGHYSIKDSQRVSINFISLDRTLADLIERFWKLEDYGAGKFREKALSVEDKRAMQIIERTTRIVDGHYEVGMLWKKDERQFPNNLVMAKQRLESLRRRLTKAGNEEMATKYREAMNSYISSGFARKLLEEELRKESDTRWYLPHHPVTSPTKPGKVRIVFDAAAEHEGTSLNKNLLTGPDMTSSLVGVLLRFRQGTIGIAADIEGMFHQIHVQQEDQDSLRFLRWTNSYNDLPDVYVMQVHIFGAASSPCVANSTLRRVAEDNAEDFSPNVTTAIKENFYVDDALLTVNDEQSAVHLARGMRDILARGGFNLTKFTSNSKEVLRTIPCDKLSKQGLDLDLDDPPIERALGILWFLGGDTLGFKIRCLDRPETKRGILSTVCSLFDPLGFAAPVALAARCLLQDLWKANVGWDEALGKEFLTRWRSWKAQLPFLSQLRIPRSYYLLNGDPHECKVQLNVFPDASEVGYGASSYLRIEYPDGQVHCAFVMGKARNAPVKFGAPLGWSCREPYLQLGCTKY